MSQYPTEINECNVVTITPMGVQCVVVHPSTSVASDGAASLIITGGTPPYSVVWNINGNNVLGLNQINLSVGEYPATVVDYYGDYSASTICVLTGETDCSFEISVDYPDPPIEEEGFYFYDVQITGGTSVGPYTIYYTTISSTTIAELYPSGVAQNLTLTQLQSGVTIKIPENNSLVIVYNQLCDTTRTKFIAPIVRCIELCLTYSGGKTIQFLCDDLDENGVQTWVADGMGTCGGSILRWDLPNNRWIIEGCVIEDGELFSNDPVTSNPPLNWNVVGSQYPISVFGTEGFCSLSNPLVLNVSVNQPDCEPDGSIILSAQGGFSPYLFSINNGLTTQSSPIFNNLGPGTYSCQVIDSSGNTENSVVVLNSLLPNVTYELQLQTTTQVIQNTTQVSNIEYTTNLVVTPPIPNGVTITFDFTHLGVFKNSRKPGFSSLNRTIVLNKNGSPISVTTTNSSTYLESVQPQCDEGGDTVQVTASTNEWNTISITQGDTIQVLTSSVITYTTPPNVCDFGIDNNLFTTSNANIQGCSCCNVISIEPPEIELPVVPPPIWNVNDITCTFSTRDITFIKGGSEFATTTVYIPQDGTRMYVVMFQNKTIRQCSLSSPHNINSTITIVGDSPIIADLNFTSMQMSSNGDKVFIFGGQPNSFVIREYSLSIPWNITTMSTTPTSILPYPSQHFIGRNFVFNRTGTKIYGSYFTSNLQTVRSVVWNLSIPYTLSSAGQPTTYDITSIINDISGNMYFENNGDFYFMPVGSNVDAVFKGGISVDDIYGTTNQCNFTMPDCQDNIHIYDTVRYGGPSTYTWILVQGLTGFV